MLVLLTVCNPYSTVNVLAQLWRREIPGKAMVRRVFKLPHEDSQMKSFIEKYDRNQQQLQTLAARDDLLSGNFNTMYHIFFIINTCTNIADNGYLVREFYDWFPHVLLPASISCSLAIC